MQKRDKIIFALIILGAVIALLIVFFLTGLLHVPTSKKTEDAQMGQITQTADDYDPVMDYHPPEDEAVETTNFVVISNIESLFGLLTLDALDKLETSLSDWLRSKAYDDSEFITFTIDESSIVNDRSYPYFELSSENGQSPRIRAYYDLPEYKWVFDFIE